MLEPNAGALGAAFCALGNINSGTYAWQSWVAILGSTLVQLYNFWQFWVYRCCGQFEMGFIDFGFYICLTINKEHLVHVQRLLVDVDVQHDLFLIVFVVYFNLPDLDQSMLDLTIVVFTYMSNPLKIVVPGWQPLMFALGHRVDLFDCV